MADDADKLTNPWFVAVWPGMGQVAISAGYYLMSKLGMSTFAEFSPRELFDVEQVAVKNGLIHPAQLPRNRCFLWRDPDKKHDLVVFVGEAQPPTGKRAFCNALLDLAVSLGVERIFTFAAMATEMHPKQASRVFTAATSPALLEELQTHDLVVLQEGLISGLNGVLLGEAAERNLNGICLLGEMPHVLAQIPYPGASLAVLKVFCEMTGVILNFEALEEQASEFSQKLSNALAQMQEQLPETGQLTAGEESEAAEPEPLPEAKLSLQDERRIFELFKQARADRSKAYGLKQELDRLGVFRDYEDDFLDLFKG